MSRVIKFRGRSTSEVDAEGSAPPIKIGDWVYGSLITANGEAFIVNGVVESNWEYIALEEWCPVDPATVGQFTGLKDKKGVEIYEGDIVALSEEFDEDRYYAIEWQVNGYWLDGWDGNEYGFPDESNLEVIGNIYENPELLESAL